MKEGEIWLVNLDPTIGAEIKKTRPAVIVSRDSIGRLPLKIIVPVTKWQPQFESVPWMVTLEATDANGLTAKSVADTFQVRSISERRLVRKIGELPAGDLAEIKQGLILSLNLDEFCR